MDREIVITRLGERLLSCLYEDGRLAEIWAEEETGAVRVGDIYIGRVKNIAANLQAAFVEIRPGITGYYSLKENPVHYTASSDENKKLHAGDDILVQVEGENLKTKGWRLTGNISLQGSLAVCFPWGSGTRISRKIRDPETRERLMQLSGNLRPGSEESYSGWTLRTDSGRACGEDILREMKMLGWKALHLKEVYRSRPVFSLLYTGKGNWEELVDRYQHDPACTIQTDIAGIYSNLEERIHGSGSKTCILRELYTDDSWPLVKLKGLEAQIEKALSKRVWMKSGASLIIEGTEALTSIDVNTGKNQSCRDTGSLFLKTNLEAVREALHQIRLRNLSGIILVDLINMKNDEDISCVLKAAREAAASDPVPTSVIDVTRLQLMEITRKKRKKPLSDMLAGICGTSLEQALRAGSEQGSSI